MSNHTAITGTKVLDRKYDAIIENPTASDNGMNSARAAPCIKNDDTKTDRTQSIASSQGTTVSRDPSRTDSASGTPRCRWV